MALQDAKAKGTRLGRKDKDRIPSSTVDRIQELRAEGLSYRKIAAQLDAEGVPTALKGAKWAGETVRQAHLANM